jgi:hypothetical protein
MTAKHHYINDKGLQNTIHQWLQTKWSNFSEVETHALDHSWGNTVTEAETTLKITTPSATLW